VSPGLTGRVMMVVSRSLPPQFWGPIGFLFIHFLFFILFLGYAQSKEYPPMKNNQKKFLKSVCSMWEIMWDNNPCFSETLELRGGNQLAFGKCKHPLQKSLKLIANSELCMHTKYY